MTQAHVFEGDNDAFARCRGRGSTGEALECLPVTGEQIGAQGVGVEQTSGLHGER